MFSLLAQKLPPTEKYLIPPSIRRLHHPFRLTDNLRYLPQKHSVSYLINQFLVQNNVERNFYIGYVEIAFIECYSYPTNKFLILTVNNTSNI